MIRFTAWLLVSLLSCSVLAADSATVAPPPGPIAASASREVSRLVRSTRPEPRTVRPSVQQPTNKSWIARHPRLFGALVGFGVGCAVGASRVGGSEDTFFNTLDEFACPVVGGIGAGAGAIVGALAR